MPYTDLATIHDPATDAVAPASWGDQVRENFEVLRKPIQARAWRSTQVVKPATNVGLYVPLTVIKYESTPIFNSTNGNLVVPAGGSGIYACNGQFYWEGGGTGFRLCAITVNTNIVATMINAPVTPGPAQIVSSDLRLNAGDVVALFIMHNNAAALGMADVGAEYSCNLSIRQVSSLF